MPYHLVFDENQVIRICRPRRLYQGQFRAKYWINTYIVVNLLGWAAHKQHSNRCMLIAALSDGKIWATLTLCGLVTSKFSQAMTVAWRHQTITWTSIDISSIDSLAFTWKQIPRKNSRVAYLICDTYLILFEILKFWNLAKFLLWVHLVFCVASK